MLVKNTIQIVINPTQSISPPLLPVLHSIFSFHWLPPLMSSRHCSFNCSIVALLACTSAPSYECLLPLASFFLFSLSASRTLRILPTLITSVRYSTLHPHSPPLHHESLHHLAYTFKCTHTPLCSLLPLQLTHILVNSQSLSPLHLLSTCLPIPESKLKAVTQCVPSQKWKCLG